MFRRRKKSGTADDGEPVDGTDLEDLETDDELDGEQGDDVPQEPPVPERPQGPWDVDDAPEDEVDRIDLGGMRVPVPPEIEVRVDVNPEGEVVAATLVRGPSTMQVNAFAAPKRSGIWDEVRSEIAASVVGTGGRVEDVQGTYGTELVAAVPVQGGGAAPARFLGVDGPRWFLRALLTGPAAVDRTAAAPLEQALRSVVVVRGSEAMAVRDPLPLRLPKEVAEQAAAHAAGQGVPELPERGPEITEVR